MCNVVGDKFNSDVKQVKAPPTEQITEHPLYKALYNHAVLTEQIVAERDAQIAKLSEDILVYQTQSADWEEHSTVMCRILL